MTLRRPQIEIDRRIVRLLKTKNTHLRTVPLTVAAATLLQNAMNHPIRPTDTELIFFGKPGRQGLRAPYAFDRVWQETKKKQELKDFHFHDLRHEAVNRFVEAGLSDQEVSAISDHKSMQILKRYAHLLAEDLVTRLDQVGPDSKNWECCSAELGGLCQNAARTQLAALHRLGSNLRPYTGLNELDETGWYLQFACRRMLNELSDSEEMKGFVHMLFKQLAERPIAVVDDVASLDFPLDA